MPETITLNKKQQTVGLVVILILVLAPGSYFYIKYRHAHQLLLASGQQSVQQVNALTKAVGAHLLLPAGEQPTVATVTDTAKLKDQPFFVNAQAGDKVLVYAQARKTILYRPSTGKIIEVAHLGVTP